MSLIDRARLDTKRIVSDLKGFATPIKFSFDGASATINGTAKKHHLEYDELGNAVNSMNASVTINESDLIVQGYPTRNSNNEVTFRGHRVEWTDATGTYSYTIISWHPDDLLGLIVCILAN